MTPTQGIDWLSRIPKFTHKPLAYFLGSLLHRNRRSVAEKGLKKALPSLSNEHHQSIGLQAARNQIKALLGLPNIHQQTFNVAGIDTLIEDAKHQGGIILSLHLGMTDAGTWYLNQKHVTTMTLVGAGTKGKRRETLWVSALLDKIKVPYIPRNPAATIQAVKAINQGHWLMMHCDMNAAGEDVSFFGHSTQVPSLGLHLAQILKCPVYFHYGWLEDTCHQLVFEKFESSESALSNQAQQLSTKMENVIKEKPEHWIWHYNRWK